ncbi:TorD/DmsD family molecular chaperone [Deferribacter autotrophicus]|uniref:TorD/DmsD family molecular chaperone n=1 Tax=Deferribacter autotrophicus TaxID=500465 RepID=UPI00165DA198|nr:molecular chaperone TorD family protein [Deferribacter autotrophicus]
MIDFTVLKTNLLKGNFESIPYERLNPDQLGLESLSSVFFFLSLCYRYPDKEIYERIKEALPVFQDFFEDYVGHLPELPGQVDMEAEYVRLFVSNYGGVVAVPYASYYLEEEKLLMGETTVALRDMMNNEGFALKEDIKEVVDHVYIILEFCSGLINKIIDMKKKNENFINTLATLFTVLYNYIGKYVVDFSDKVIEGSNLAFYKDVSAALKGLFLELDEVLAEIFDL